MWSIMKRLRFVAEERTKEGKEVVTDENGLGVRFK
jgi:hypothetical protein